MKNPEQNRSYTTEPTKMAVFSNKSVVSSRLTRCRLTNYHSKRGLIDILVVFLMLDVCRTNFVIAENSSVDLNCASVVKYSYVTKGGGFSKIPVPNSPLSGGSVERIIFTLPIELNCFCGAAKKKGEEEGEGKGGGRQGEEEEEVPGLLRTNFVSSLEEMFERRRFLCNLPQFCGTVNNFKTKAPRIPLGESGWLSFACNSGH
ncbi:hypothetical protein LSTR_LSTR010510 [Laodelphax striatellus]|uniref:Uncharacterized protein n=1 Tax=Laodelphax striatellus TaxID=195883 RepID=A0A482WR58_LAOST|nr:hypothetical protein LSTR_LSTR010510 [Laodelphax striatellus]